jgi:hypothetical protein
MKFIEFQIETKIFGKPCSVAYAHVDGFSITGLDASSAMALAHIVSQLVPIAPVLEQPGPPPEQIPGPPPGLPPEPPGERVLPAASRRGRSPGGPARTPARGGPPRVAVVDQDGKDLVPPAPAEQAPAPGANGAGAAHPEATAAEAPASAPEKTTGDNLAPELRQATKLKEVFLYLVAQGADTRAKLLDAVGKIRTELPLLAQYEDLPDRVARAAEVLSLPET